MTITLAILCIILAYLWDASNIRAHRAEQQIIDLYATIHTLKDHDHNNMRKASLRPHTHHRSERLLP